MYEYRGTITVPFLIVADAKLSRADVVELVFDESGIGGARCDEGWNLDSIDPDHRCCPATKFGHGPVADEAVEIENDETDFGTENTYAQKETQP